MKFQFFEIKNRKLLYVTLLILILIVYTFSYLFVYFNMENKLKVEVDALTNTVLEKSKSPIDQKLDIIQKLAINISVKPEVSQLLWYAKKREVAKQYYIYSVANIMFPKMLNYDTNYAYEAIDDIYIYFKDINKVVGSTVSYDADFYYKYIKQYDRISYNQWLEMMKDPNNVEFTPFKSIVPSIMPIPITSDNKTEQRRNVVLYMMPIPNTMVGKVPDGQIVIELKESFLLDNLKQLSINNGTAYILDKNNTVIASLTKDIPLINYSWILEQEKNFKINSGNETNYITYIKSDVTDWIYVYTTKSPPNEEYSNIIGYIFVSFSVVIAMFIILLAFLFYKSIFRPIEDLVAKYDGINKYTNQEEMLEYIEKTLHKYRQESVSIKNQIEDNNLYIKNYAHAAFLTEKNKQTKRDLLQKFAYISEDFSFPFFVAIHVEIQNLNELEDYQLMKYIIANVVTDLAPQNSRAFFLEVSATEVGIIMNYKENMKMIEVISEIAIHLKSFMMEKYQSRLYIGVGNEVSDILDVHTSYENCVSALQNNPIRKQTEIIVFDDCKILQWSFKYSLQTEMILMECLKIGDLENASKVLLEVIALNKTAEEINAIANVQSMAFILYNTVIRVLDELKINPAQIFTGNYLGVEFSRKFNSISQLEKEFIDILKNTCYMVQTRKKSQNTDLKDNMLKYVQDNYLEADCSLKALADVFKINMAYASSFFKEQTGENFTDYIRKLKIEKAKRLLVESEESIEYISQVLGYSNSGVFIRNFKKYTGVTPGQYRLNNDK